ncbi:mannobiose 2-epimerase [Flavobacterium aquidurense]|uniref:Cellobiose 2-epimerase n=1 Tax=Flavobacterium frigidimaris TaxID=262320 RepID=A0ABX4BJJ8_FLAFR|nr:AGE family epimerase/isomerase [Flavobacterium frigidimaris]OXA75052.1 N-acyl-D-glucosamine 2-epimerase [Flavobacterium frigidimaris]SDZ08784.1 mannobiose 2-epimerase [Flavobacterium aquidurense]
MSATTKKLKSELSEELDYILNYWSINTLDYKNGGFIGQIDYDENHLDKAEKGSVLHARILWTFSAAYQETKNENNKEIAKRAFEFLYANFYDTEFGGLFWSINADTTPKDTKNQIYALAFAIYGLSEYYAISQNAVALTLAKNLYSQIQKHSYDPINKGYLEAFTREWEPIEDLRLSDKDANEKKTMNTHLHIVEAYANLYKVWKDKNLQTVIIELLATIEAHFINTETGHLRLFFDENWIEKPDVISYGHDIEAAWLLLQCAQISEDKILIENYTKYAIQMAEVTQKGLDTDGGLWYEYDSEKDELVAEKHWWVQAEALIGFYNAYQLTNDEKYLNLVLANWNFIKKYILDTKNGEWFWGINRDYSLIEKDKAGFWKCPYHNSRACLELIQRINS